MSIFLSDAEVDEMSAGYTRNAARVRHLQALGLTVARKPNGRPLVLRSHAEAVLAGRAATTATEAAPEPAKGLNRAALADFLAERKRRR